MPLGLAQPQGSCFVGCRFSDMVFANLVRSKARPMSHPRVFTDPSVMMGKPCIKGTRITVELILRKLGAGRSFADLLQAYPELSEDDFRAALAFAADYMQHETILAAE